MTATDVTDPGVTVLRTLQQLADSRQVVTVHAAAIAGRLTYMDTYDLINELFASGYITHDLQVTEAGRKAME
ncbi:hypothetical protein [Euzebya tangerina]|uniref:hypothetical protein n=1 Tax=Euzebya tangerina TaxID=591198 RepID=UPI000E30F0C3|nr:hypothetical protein [Euzebya tangerina]